jgi:hypothetical protein
MRDDASPRPATRTRVRDRGLDARSLAALCLCVVGLGTASWAGAAAPPATPDDRAAQSLHLDVRGAIAEVRVHRKLTTCDGVPWSSIRATSGARTRSPGECILDLALPAGAALLRVDLAGSGAGSGAGTRAIGPAGGGGKATDTAEQRYVEAARATGHEPAAAAFDAEVRYRLRIVDTRPKPGTLGTAERLPPTELDFTYAAPLSLEGNLAHLDFPAAPELSPPETAVEIRASLGVPVERLSIAGENSLRQPRAAAVFVVRSADLVSTRSAWRVTFTLSRPRGARAEPPPVLALASVGPRPGRGGKTRLALALGRPGIEAAPVAAVELPAPDRAGMSGTSPALAERVLFVIDRSRSVGYGGLEAERDFALELLRNLPPSTRFDAVFFDRTPRRLFPVARQATRQALGALGEALVPENLANGTELVPAIRFAAELLEREATEFGPRPLLVVLTDGAVGAAAGGRDPWTVATEGAGATTRSPQVRLQLPDLLVAVVSIRPNDDPSTSLDERQRLQGLAAAASSGGIEAAFHVGDLTQGLGDVLSGLRAGGAVFDVDLAAASPSAAARLPVARQIVPGGGITLLTELPGGGSGTRLSLRQRGRRLSLPLHPTPVAAAALEALSSQGASPGARPEPGRFLAGPGFVALWEPVRQADAPATAAPGLAGSGRGEGGGSATPPESAGPRGFMERSVVRDSLSLAYTPRARACYLTRSARTPEDRDLSGRVRIAIDLVRGEVGAARILSSTLARPSIEQCLRESAFALDVPRAYRNDDPVTAVLNLVFRPRTSDHRPPVDRSAFDRELELVIEAAGLAPIPEGPSDAGIPAPADAPVVGAAGAAFPRPDARPRVDLPDND